MEKYTREGNNRNRKSNSNEHSGDRNIKNQRTNNSQQKKTGLNARNEKAKYSDDEISRARYIDSKAKFLVRDRIHNDNIDTRNKWIGISNLKSNDRWDSYGNYTPEILSFDAEIFDRTEQPQYEEYMTEDEKHLLTYEVAESDIAKQKKTEKRTHTRTNRPRYHVEVTTRLNHNQKTEYQVKSIKRLQ